MASGLEGVVVARTVLCEVDGERGRLIVRGRGIQALAETMAFEEMAALVWGGLSGSPENGPGVREALGEARCLAFSLLEPILGEAARLRAIDAFYTALLLEACGIPRDMFTGAFAMGRVLGWTAHVFEQVESGRLMRPLAEYVGPSPEPAAV